MCRPLPQAQRTDGVREPDRRVHLPYDLMPLDVAEVERQIIERYPALRSFRAMPSWQGCPVSCARYSGDPSVPASQASWELVDVTAPTAVAENAVREALALTDSHPPDHGSTTGRPCGSPWSMCGQSDSRPWSGPCPHRSPELLTPRRGGPSDA